MLKLMTLNVQDVANFFREVGWLLVIGVVLFVESLLPKK